MQADTIDQNHDSLGALGLMAILATAGHVACEIRDRKQGFEPSGLEPSHRALSFLADARDDLLGAVVKLDIAISTHAEPNSEDNLTMVLTIGHSVRLLHGMHQRMLSLYPDVSIALIERVRRLESRIQSMFSSESEDWQPEIAVLANELRSLALDLDETGSAGLH